MAVRIRMKKIGRRHRPFFRICAMDSRNPRDGRVLEELGTYDPILPDVDARAVLKGERIDYWLSVGALPTEKVGVLIKKYGSSGTHLQQQETALFKLAESRRRPEAPTAKPEDAEAEVAAEAPVAEAAPEAPAEKSTEDSATEETNE
ncbi:MAG: 30S ribosomal protein S16 [Thermoguttaceae bacterium]